MRIRKHGLLEHGSLKHGSLKIVGFCTVIVFVVALCMSILFVSATVAFAVNRSIHASASPASAETQNAPAEQNPAIQNQVIQNQATQNADQTTPPVADLKTLNGMVTDSYCGARHVRNSNRSSTECARICIRRGAGYILVNSDGSYLLHGHKSMINPFAGQRVKVVGTL
ncbi:MAG TPA: hypothetical protein VGF44_06630, partial [Terriglobales bacterium]